MELPLAVGTKGGVLGTNMVYQDALLIMNHPTSSRLAEVMASVGLACNLSAVRALATEGI